MLTTKPCPNKECLNYPAKHLCLTCLGKGIVEADEKPKIPKEFTITFTAEE